ncbi:MAG: hypothetical protein NTV95_03745 [Candidatus Saccharibacteria bacterium]|nr:hypothetical protein [Candidatus Saccharibacteria bacterium]
MEDAPRNNDNEEGILPQPDIEQSTSDSYSRIWRRLRMRKTDYLISGKESDEDDEDEDEISRGYEDSSENVKRYQKRFLRLRKKIRPFLPTLETVQSDAPVKEPSSILETPNIHEVNVDEQIIDIEAPNDNNKKETDTFTEGKVEDKVASKDPESVLAILRRSTMNNEFIHTIDANAVRPNAVQETNSSPQYIQEAKISPKAPSFSDKYFEKKEQKKHIKKIHDKEIKVQNRKQEELRKDLESKIVESEKQHYILKKSIERETPTQSKQIESINKSKKHNVKKEVDPKLSTEKMIKVSEAHQQEQDMREALIMESRKEIDRLSSFDKTLKKVNELKKSTITNEFAFERRHEVKDEPGSGVNTKFIPLSEIERKNMELSIGKSQSELNNKGKTTLTRAVREMQKSGASSHAASAGALGAIVGALIFLAIHTLF